MELSEAADLIQQFQNDSLTARIAELEGSIRGLSLEQLETAANLDDVDVTLLWAASVLKQAAGQVTVVIHAVGILASLSHILEPDEAIESLSLGAGNTGRKFDLETDRRIAEFKFIQWRGGSEAIRQNALFKDFFSLAEADTTKRRLLYVLGRTHPMKFLRGGRALSSVLSRNRSLQAAFKAKFGNRFVTVAEYYKYREGRVEVVDLQASVPDLVQIF